MLTVDGYGCWVVFCKRPSRKKEEGDGGRHRVAGQSETVSGDQMSSNGVDHNDSSHVQSARVGSASTSPWLLLSLPVND